MKKSAAVLMIGLAALVFSNGRWAVPVMAGLAPVFLLQFTRAARPWIGLPVMGFLFVGAAKIMLQGIIPSHLGGFGWLLTSYYALLWFVPYLLDRLLHDRTGGFLSTLVFPCASVAAEYLNAVALGDWTSTAFGQIDNLPFAQILSVTGLWGVVFLVAWFGPVALWARHREFEWKKIRGGLAVFAGVVLLVLTYGGLRLVFCRQAGPTVRMASLHLDDEAMDVLTSRSPAQDVSAVDQDVARKAKKRALDLYFERSARCARRGAAVVFWPETAVTLERDDETGFLARASQLASGEGVYFMPAYYLEPAADGTLRGENKCAMFEPSGREVWRYVKAHPVPGSSDAPGRRVIPVTDAPFGRIAAAICYDMDFPPLIRQAGRDHVDIMLVPAWDWRAIDPLHSRMAVCRALENGFSMVRHTVEGLSLAVDGFGRTLSALDHFRTADREMFVDVPARGVRTLYSVTGDIIAWLSLAGLAALAGRALFRRSR